MHRYINPVVSVDMSTKPVAASLCHCKVCRKLTGAPMMATVLLPTEAVKMTVTSGAELLTLATSKHVNRLRCPRCFSPVLATMGDGKKGNERVGVPLALFDAALPKHWLPQHHLWYEQRVLDVDDTLPKKRRGHFSGLYEPSADSGGRGKESDVSGGGGCEGVADTPAAAAAAPP
jgi:hypothetical protein